MGSMLFLLEKGTERKAGGIRKLKCKTNVSRWEHRRLRAADLKTRCYNMYRRCYSTRKSVLNVFCISLRV